MDNRCFALQKGTAPGAGGRTNRGAQTAEFCAVLKGECPGTMECPFYQTRVRCEESRRRAFRRIRQMPEYCRIGIAMKYYGGQAPWNKEKREETV